MARHIIDACRSAGTGQIAVVVGYEAEAVKAALSDDVTYALQAEQLGTGNAAAIGLDSLPNLTRSVLVLAGDTPLVTSETLGRLIDTHTNEANAATLLTAVLPDAGNYGRIVRGPDGSVKRIVEAKDATPEIKAIREFNPSFYVFDAEALREKLRLLKPENVQGELYLTDVIELMAESGQKVGAVVAPEYEEVLGINTRVELADAARLMSARIARDHMLSGVTFADPATAYVDVDVEIGQDTVIMPCTIIKRGCRIGSGCEIGPYARLTRVQTGNNVKVQFTAVEDMYLEDSTTVSGCSYVL